MQHLFFLMKMTGIVQYGVGMSITESRILRNRFLFWTGSIFRIRFNRREQNCAW